ncbi:MAG: PQQ-binding-like beta-propeller repeat protein [Pirellulaceae bacterium]|nr:PQQ-binding-like beta-propeller repeat protein [Pirellulaceae bacterium]
MIRSMFNVCWLICSFTAWTGSLKTSTHAEDWPQFRGHNASGVSTESKNLPIEFGHDHNVKWSAEVGKGVACPIVANKRAFTTAMVDEQTFAVFSFDAMSGDLLWRREFDAGEVPAITAPNEQASSTPASDGARVYVHFSTLGMLALSAADGKVLWQQDLPMPFYLLGWGAANSPIVFKDKVIFNLDDDLAPYLIAFDKFSGEVLWKTPRPEMLGGYATPVVCTANGRSDVVVAGSGKLKGYDPETGEERWTCNTLLRTIMTSPVVSQDRIFISIQSYGDTNRVLKYALLQWRDTNQDERLDKTEVNEAFWEKFDSGDHNGDGFLAGEEIDAAFQSPDNLIGGGTTIQAVRGGGEGNVTDTHVIWNIENNAPSNISSPLVVNDRLLVVKKGGISAAFQVTDGETVWLKKRIKNFGNYYASPVCGDDKIYITGENGYIVVLDATQDKPVVLKKNDMGDSCTATPAIANNRLYVRTLHKLYCVGL